MSGPVTVSITRHVDPRHAPEMLAWLQAGVRLAESFDGFLGSGWVRPADDSPVWHMLYRFATDDDLAAWEASPQRQWWLAAAQGRVEATHVERRTGIEGWFDEPLHTEEISAQQVDVPPAAVAPPRWKQMVVIFIVFFPLSAASNWIGGLTMADWPLLLRVLVSVLVMTPLMTYLLLPLATRRMQWFLHPARR